MVNSKPSPISKRLDELLTGDQGIVRQINTPDAELMALRLGIGVGEALTCLSKVPGGPIVIAKGAAEIALGRTIAQEIEVMVL